MELKMATEIANPLELHVVDLINTEREQAGLNPVHVEVHLNGAAQGHSNWMAGEQAISHSGENGSSPTDRIENAEFPLAGGSWNITENVAYTGLNGQPSEADIDRLHSALMESPSHQENILDPDVTYVGIGLSMGSVEEQSGAQNALFITQNFANTSQPVSVQEVVDGQTVITSYVNGEPVPGTSEPAPNPDGIPDQDNDASVEDEGSEQENDDEQTKNESAGGSCFVATAAYGNRLHPDVVTLRNFRDHVLVRHPFGRVLIRLYWKAGPVMAKAVKARGISGRIARMVLQPLVLYSRNILHAQQLIAVPSQDVRLKPAWRATLHQEH